MHYSSDFSLLRRFLPPPHLKIVVCNMIFIVFTTQRKIGFPSSMPGHVIYLIIFHITFSTPLEQRWPSVRDCRRTESCLDLRLVRGRPTSVHLPVELLASSSVFFTSANWRNIYFSSASSWGSTPWATHRGNLAGVKY